MATGLSRAPEGATALTSQICLAPPFVRGSVLTPPRSFFNASAPSFFGAWSLPFAVALSSEVASATGTELATPDAAPRHFSVVFRRASRFFSKTEAEEVVHEVFVKVMEKQSTFKSQSSPVTWLYRITTNHCLNRLRNEGRRRELLEQQTPIIRRRLKEAPNQATNAFLADVWGKLDQELVRVGIYHFVDGMTNPEIARLLGCSPRTVVNRLQALRAQAAALIGQEPEGGAA